MEMGYSALEPWWFPWEIQCKPKCGLLIGNEPGIKQIQSGIVLGNHNTSYINHGNKNLHQNCYMKWSNNNQKHNSISSHSIVFGLFINYL